MRPVLLPAPVHQALIAQARAGYPREVCAALLAPMPAAEAADGATLVLEAAVPLTNRAARPGQCFEIAPAELLQTQRHAESLGRVVCGFCHSHPDGDARPSMADIEGCPPWSGYVQLILSLDGQGRTATRAYSVTPHGWRHQPLLGV